jgi:hypothetical protein
MYSIRFMRHLYHYRADMSAEDWVEAVKPDSVVPQKIYPNQYVLTRERVLEVRREPGHAQTNPSKWRPKGFMVEELDSAERKRLQIMGI